MSLETLLRSVRTTHFKFKTKLTLHLTPNFKEYYDRIEDLHQQLYIEREKVKSQLERVLDEQEDFTEEPEEFLLPGDEDYLTKKRKSLQRRTSQAEDQLPFIYELDQTLTYQLETYDRLLNLTENLYRQLQIVQIYYETNQSLKEVLSRLSYYLSNFGKAPKPNLTCPENLQLTS